MKPLKTIVPSGLTSTVRESSSATFTNHSFVAIRTSNRAAVSSMCSAALIDAGLIPDPETIIADYQREIDTLRKLKPAKPAKPATREKRATAAKPT